MSRMLSGMVGRIADKLLPQTSAAAGCASDCFYSWKLAPKGQVYPVHCCYLPNCTLNCVA
ncbi:hypothetical protein ACH4S8_41950 [Streptomyces sp. NPDC021080]|uniref:hypothetical protein n=1 Tax=Streptomyces sp. NPDC021080 TaxID=3365110 RepID=UPI003798BF4B